MLLQWITLARLASGLRAGAVLTIIGLIGASFCCGTTRGEEGRRALEANEKRIRQFGVDPSVLKLYEVIDFRYTGGMFRNELVHCGIIKPNPLKSGEKYPLVVWLAGIGPEELDEKAAVGHLRWLDQVIQAGGWSSQKRPYYILVMKVNAKKGKWFDRHGDPPISNMEDLGDEQITVLHELMQTVFRSHAIDRERVYLMGVSAGGSACFEFAMRYPELIAAMVPMASEGGDLSRVTSLVDVPVWTFHATGDNPEKIRRTIATLENAGGIALLTEIEGSEHNCWTQATKRYDIFGWLFSQRKHYRGYPPGYTPLPWWNWIALGAILGVGYLVWRSRANSSSL